MKELYIGVMSGTSLDGIDVALCEIDEKECKLLHFSEYPFPLALKSRLLHTIFSSVTLQEIGTLNQELGYLFADAIQEFIRKHTLSPSHINAIGLHGQTLWHEPHGVFPFSMQLGCPNVVASQTAIKTITDFRQMDIVHGGEGAPFAPAFHQFLFRAKEQRAVVNIGGMANITLLEDEIKGWDSGCGNVLLDFWMQKKERQPYDEDGKFAKSGTVIKPLLKTMLEDAYFVKKAPKSTGREYFNEAWLSHYLDAYAHLSSKDIARTLLELTAQTIINDIQEKRINQLIVCGGGSKNAFLMQRLKELSGIEVVSSDFLGVNADALEAMAFAWFAYKRIHLEPVKLCSVTGAKKASLLGGIYE